MQIDSWSTPSATSSFVPAEVALRRELHADEQPDTLLDGIDVRLDELEAVHPLKSAIQVHEGDARLFFRRPARLDHVLDALDGRFSRTHVLPRRAEEAIETRLRRPERADRVDVDGEVGSLQHADARHRRVVRRVPRVPGRLERHAYVVCGRDAFIDDSILAFLAALQAIRRRLREPFDDRHVHPDFGLEARPRRDGARGRTRGRRACATPIAHPRATRPAGCAAPCRTGRSRARRR